jgi:hypothetical protein
MGRSNVLGTPRDMAGKGAGTGHAFLLDLNAVNCPLSSPMKQRRVLAVYLKSELDKIGHKRGLLLAE